MQGVGAPVRERTAQGADEALEGVREALGRGHFPILSTDLSRLPYWGSRTPFGGHRVVLVGQDEGRRIAWVADTDRPDLEEIGFEQLDAARSSVAPPVGSTGRPWLEVDAPSVHRPLPDMARDALRRQALDRLGAGGLAALGRFAEDLAEWPLRARDERDLARCFRFAYQVIEVRGTGGALFRSLYARILREVEAGVDGFGGLGLAARMEALAEGWTHLAGALRALGEGGLRVIPPNVVGQAAALAEGERRFFEEVAARVSEAQRS